MTDKLIMDIESYGARPGEIRVMMASRQTGKSVLSQYAAHWSSIMEPPFEKIGRATVDGEPWYTVKCNREVSQFIRSQSGEDKRWFPHIDGRWYVHTDTFDICEDIYLQLGLKYV